MQELARGRQHLLLSLFCWCGPQGKELCAVQMQTWLAQVEGGSGECPHSRWTSAGTRGADGGRAHAQTGGPGPLDCISLGVAGRTRGLTRFDLQIPTATSPSIAPTDFSSSRAPSSLGSYPVGAFVASLQATAPPAPSPTTSSSGHFSSARHDSWGSSTAPSSVSAASAYPSPPLASPVGLASPPTLASLTLNTVSSPPAPPPVPNTYAAPSPLELSPQASIAGVRDASPVFSAKGKEPARERSNTTAEEQQREKIAMYNNASQQQRARELSNESAGSVAMSRMSSSRSSRHSSIGPPSEPAPTSPLPQLPPPSQQASPAVLVRAQRAYAPSPSTSLDNLSPYEVEDDSRDHDDDEEDDDDDDASILDPNPMGAPSSLAASRLSFGTTRAESGSTYPDDELEDIPPVPQISRRHVSPLGPSPLAPTPAPAPAPIPPPSRESVEMAGWRAAAAEAAARGQRRASQTVLSSSPEQIRPQLPRVTPASPPMRARSQRSIPPSNSLGKVSSPPLFQSTQQNQHQPQHPYGNYPAPSPSPPIAAVAGPSSPPARRPFTNPSIITSAYDASNRDRHDSLGSSNASTVHIGHRHGSISSENAPPLPTPQRSATLSTPDEEAIWRDYRSKSFTLAVSPPIDSGRWKPGQVFMFRLTLGPKASKTSFDKLDVRLVGSSYVHMVRPIHSRSLLNATQRNADTLRDVRAGTSRQSRLHVCSSFNLPHTDVRTSEGSWTRSKSVCLGDEDPLGTDLRLLGTPSSSPFDLWTFKLSD